MKKTNEIEKRLAYIDWLKLVGIFLVILAHVDAPRVIEQLRSFDVPMLVFLSAVLAKKTYKPGNIGYIKKRVVRLAVPTWIFLVIFCVVLFVMGIPMQWIDILKAFTFQRDAQMLGFFWVIWVYLICAMLIPIIKKAGVTKFKFVVSLMLLGIFEMLCCLTSLSENRFMYCTFFTIIPYGFITFIGYNYDKFTKETKYILAGSSSIIFIIYTVVSKVITNEFALISDYKYPAQIYYLSYSIPIIIVLYELFKTYVKKVPKIVSFISQSSLWIYLWHILCIYGVKFVVADDSLWWLQYILTVILSIGITFAQNKIVDYIENRTQWSFLKILRG